MKWNCENGYIEQFDRNYRGTIGDRFCRAVRDGHDDVKAILAAVKRDVQMRDGDVWQQVARSLDSIDAWDFAQHILDRESLPWEEKAALKETATGTAPTVKQLKYLEGLRCPVVPKTKSEASTLIEQFRASKEQQPRIEHPLPF